MLVYVSHAITGEEVSKELPVTKEEIMRWQSGELIQNVWPDLSSDDREFLMTGMSQEEWDKLTEEDTEGLEGSLDEGLEPTDSEALASAGRGTDEDYGPASFDDIPF